MVATICQQCGASSDADDRFCSRCGAARGGSTGAPTDPLLGRTVGGAYTLHELIGVGGMGRVYRAEQTALGRTVAIKVIHPHLLGDDRIVARFYNEARAASRLNHPNSVSIIDFGRTDDGILYLAMEFLQGKDLALVAHEEGPLPVVRVCKLLDGVLGALGEAHALGVVHRDLKPENIIVRPFRTGGDLVKVVDFGLATIVSGEGRTAVTQAGMVCGTPDYMSPEQGRGDPVDGRGDVYALGVVLFELLTEQLPFEDETPTRVVLRHISDPIPDPVAAAPHRKISRELAAVIVRAMAKAPEERFQTAEEMQASLRRALEVYRAAERAEITCPTCGVKSASSMRFCGSCGSRLGGASASEALPLRSSPLPSPYRPPRTSDRTFVGREDELDQIQRLRERAAIEPMWVHVTGEPGVGRTRLLAEVATVATADGDRVIAIGPHPSRAPVPYHAVRALLGGLLGVAPGDLGAAQQRASMFPSPLSRAGLEEVIDPTGLPRARGGRAGAVAEAAATVLRRAAMSARITLVVDELDVCDALSARVIESLPHLADGAPLFILTSGPPGSLPEAAIELPLLGLDLNAAGQFLTQREDDGRKGTLMSGRFMLPLYLEQVEALGAQGGEAVPPRLADAVAMRIDRIDGRSRKLLQAISVLGDRCTVSQLKALEGPHELGALETLHSHRLVRVTGEDVEIAHPFIRELVHASIPAEARRALHRAALALATESGAPLEVRAEHAFRGDEAMSALMLLERMGDRSLQRGDAASAVLAYRRALELARRGTLESGDMLLEGAIVTFSRKLGEALDEAGDVVGADGVLREALDLASPGSTERGLMLLALGQVAARRERHRDALRLLGLALELAESKDDRAAQARVHHAIARTRRAEGEHDAAIASYRRALDLGLADIRAILELAETLLELNQQEEARVCFERAREQGRAQGAGTVVAAATAGLAGLAAALGADEEAANGYREAARIAAEAGDADGTARWRSAAEALGAASHNVA